MNFDLTEDQTMLRTAVQRYAIDHCGIDRRRSARLETAGFSAGNWAILGELGLIAAPLPEAVGGLALGPVEISLMFEELGRGLSAEPLGDAVVGAARTFVDCAEAVMVEAWADELVAGTKRLSFALHERAHRYDVTVAGTRALRDSGSSRLSGQKIAVQHATGADAFLVSAAEAGGGIALYLVEAGTAGLDLVPYRQIDGSIAAVMHLHDVRATARLSGGDQAIRDAQTRMSFAHSAEAIGLMSYLFDTTLDYLKQREQFGQRLGGFQALQHRMSAQYVALEQSRSLMLWALARMNGAPDERERVVAGLRSFVLEAGVNLGHEAIQLHGGMGVTDELAVGHAHKRLVQIARGSQPPELALDCYAGLSGKA